MLTPDFMPISNIVTIECGKSSEGKASKYSSWPVCRTSKKYDCEHTWPNYTYSIGLWQR